MVRRELSAQLRISHRREIPLTGFAKELLFLSIPQHRMPETGIEFLQVAVENPSRDPRKEPALESLQRRILFVRQREQPLRCSLVYEQAADTIDDGRYELHARRP